MLGHRPFYYQTINNIIVAFGSIFKDIEMVKYHANTRAELQRLTVPLTYEGKETYITRLEADPELIRGTQINLPAMTYEMTGIRYDANRKLTSFMQNQIVQSGNNATKFSSPVPYNMAFDVNIYVRNMEDGLQIVEQILPFFTPDFTLGVKYVSISNNYISYDLPIILEEVNFSNQYEGPSGTVRTIVWTLNFNVKTWLFGPTPSIGVIKESIINLRDYNSSNIVSVIDTQVSPITANSTDSYNIVSTITETGA